MNLNNFLTEAALGNPDGMIIVEQHSPHGFLIYDKLAIDDDMIRAIVNFSIKEDSFVEDSLITVLHEDGCKGSLYCGDGEVNSSFAMDDYGPYLYSAAMKLVKPNGICPDQTELSDDAEMVWRRFYKESEHNNNIVLTAIKPMLYPEQPFRNFYYKIEGPCIADPLIENGRRFIEELENRL
jgi:hypothetical protein